MKRHYLLMLSVALFITGCSGLDWFPQSNSASSSTSNTAPSLSMAYHPASVFAGYSSTLTYTITNGTGNPAQSGLGFTNQIDASLTVTAASQQCGGSVSTSGSKIIFSNGLLAAGVVNCAISAKVKGTTVGTFTNNTTDISGLAGGLLNGAAAQSLTITSLSSLPSLSMAYHPTAIVAGSSSALTYTITNGTGNPAQSGLGFTDQFDASLTVTAATPQCGGSVTTSGAKIIFSNGLLAAGTANCTISATVTGPTAGAFTNKATDITGLAGSLLNNAADQLLTVYPSSVQDPTGVVTISIVSVSPTSFDSGTQLLTYTASLNSANSSQNALNITIGFVAVDANGSDILATTNYVDASVSPGANQFSVPLDVSFTDTGKITFWRIIDVSLR